MAYLIYGAYGYTGELIAQRALQEGHQPVLAGRNPKELNRVASSLDLDARVVSLKEPGRLRSVLNEVSAVLHCAGPFAHTAAPMAAACLDTGTHYLDITGEIPVFQALMDRRSEAENNGCVLLPGVGFDVVPTDCLARFLYEEMPSATTLEIAFTGTGGVSKGTLKTLVEQMGTGGFVRRQGTLVEVPPGWSTRTVDFDDHPRTVISIPWADVVTSGHSTDIPNVTVYTYLPGPARTLLRLSRFLQGVLSRPVIQRLLQRGIEWAVPNPSAVTRRSGNTQVWASVRNDQGQRRSVRLQGPDAYTFTARAAVRAVEGVVEGTVEPGYQTPSTAFGHAFVRGIDGVQWIETEGDDVRA